ncbi:MAG: hypothetical protein GY769_20130 [bacterium]|nr:hypothetical protein [bacterium]
MIYANMVDCYVHVAVRGARLLDPDGVSLSIDAVSGTVISAGADYLRVHASEVWLSGETEAVEADPPQELTLHAMSIASAQLLEEPSDDEEADDDEEEEDDEEHDDA